MFEGSSSPVHECSQPGKESRKVSWRTSEQKLKVWRGKGESNSTQR